MTNSKSTKRALFSSVVALLLCFTMLLGTTFAWFTDSATSATNKIVAGNLDVELYHADKAQPTDELVGSTTKLFDDVTLWEPGAMVWEKLTVKNNGSLALKYVLSVNVTDISTVNGKSLADVLKVAVLTEEPTRENVAAAATQSLATFNLKSDKELTAGNSDVVYVAIYWAPSANDNDYNVAGEALNATLGVTLLATQYTYETDSFDNQYDKDATYDGSISGDEPSIPSAPENAAKVTNFAELKAAMANGGDIEIMNDIAMEETLTISNNVAIYGGKNSLTYADGYTGMWFDISAAGSLSMYSIVLDGNNEWTLDDSGAPVAEGTVATARAFNQKGNLTFNDVTVQNFMFTGKNIGLINSSTNGTNLLIENSTIQHCANDDYDLILLTAGAWPENVGSYIFKNVNIEGNIGGGDFIQVYTGGYTLTMEDCKITNNKSGDALVYCRRTVPTFTNCTITGNVIEGDIFDATQDNYWTFNNIVIKNNTCDRVIYYFTGQPIATIKLLSGEISGNTVKNADGYGIYVVNNGQLMFGEDMVITDNVYLGENATLTNDGVINGNVFITHHDSSSLVEVNRNSVNNGAINGDVTVDMTRKEGDVVGTWTNNGTITGTYTDNSEN